eukprot:4613719-Alexandrium_andersonii.AAC.1
MDAADTAPGDVSPPAGPVPSASEAASAASAPEVGHSALEARGVKKWLLNHKCASRLLMSFRQATGDTLRPGSRVVLQVQMVSTFGTVMLREAWLVAHKFGQAHYRMVRGTVSADGVFRFVMPLTFAPLHDIFARLHDLF